jgi:hypothetical protein
MQVEITLLILGQRLDTWALVVVVVLVLLDLLAQILEAAMGVLELLLLFLAL